MSKFVTQEGIERLIEITKSELNKKSDINHTHTLNEIDEIEANSIWSLPHTAKLTFYDDFEGNTLDMTKWAFPLETWGSQKSTNVSVDGNSNLVLATTVNENNNGAYTGFIQTGSWEIQSNPSFIPFEQTYGYFEARIKFPCIPGVWGAFWLNCDEMNLGESSTGTGGAEIDIVEAIGGGSEAPLGISSAIHYGGYTTTSSKTNAFVFPVNVYDGNYHTFGLKWTAGKYYFYCDGYLTMMSNFGGICEVPCYLLLSMHYTDSTTNTWAGTINYDDLPVYTYVDYVKAWSIDENSEDKIEQKNYYSNENVELLSEGGSSYEKINSDQINLSQTAEWGSVTFSYNVLEKNTIYSMSLDYIALDSAYVGLDIYDEEDTLLIKNRFTATSTSDSLVVSFKTSETNGNIHFKLYSGGSIIGTVQYKNIKITKNF